MDGWIKLHRCFLDWEWYDEPGMVWLFLKCLLLANYEDKKWHGIDLPRGSFVTSYESLSSKKAKVSVMQVRTIIKRLILTGELTIKTTNKYTVISIINYNKYQEDNKQINKQLTNKQQTNNKQITTTKNIKNIRNKELIHKCINKEFGNPMINFILKEFENQWGYKPTDRQPRWAAKNLMGDFKKIVEANGKEFTQQSIEKLTPAFFRWLKKREGDKKYELLASARRKLPIYKAEVIDAIIRQAKNEEITMVQRIG